MQYEISSEGALTLTEELLDHLGAKPGDELVIEYLPGGRIGLRTAEIHRDDPRD